MRLSKIGFAALLMLCPAIVSLSACGSNPPSSFVLDDAGMVVPSGSGSSSSGGSAVPSDDGGGIGPLSRPDGAVMQVDSSVPTGPVPTAIGTVTAADCMGCSFPPATATACASAPPINIKYPNDRVLVPPNMGLISVQWSPNGTPYTKFEVDFSSPPNTDWRIITTCGASYQTKDMQTSPPTPSGGCDLPIQGASWSFLAAANRGGNAVQITVRGTTDGTCATTSANTINLSFASDDLLGTYYYWKSTVSMSGTGGQIWSQLFGAPASPEQDVSSAAIQNATCNGCHSLSRDGSRMVVYSDDNDSDDEYNDVAGSLLDMTTMPNATEFINTGVTGIRQGGQPPGFSTIDPLAVSYVTSNGSACGARGGGGRGGGGGGCGAGYPAAVPTNGFSIWNGQNANFIGGVAIGAPGTRPTMPDWSIDGKSLVYVVPAGEFTSWRQDDAHIYGGSLYTVPYTGGGTFGTPAVFLQSTGENNYYPSYSPDVPMSYIIFNRTPNAQAGAMCMGGFCKDDSFSNPAARLMLIGASASNAAPVDLENANGSPAASPVPVSNSYPRWAPFVQTYKGNKILWFTFSSTRDYGLRVLNGKMGMYQCYPADAAETPGGAHQQPFLPQCQEPQLWMAPITFTEGGVQGKDPSFPAFWVPYQDITTHNHTAQWTEQAAPPSQPPPTGCTCSMLGGDCGAKNACGCCAGHSLLCSGSNTCISPPS